jgi:hypothetical protein
VFASIASDNVSSRACFVPTADFRLVFPKVLPDLDDIGDRACLMSQLSLRSQDAACAVYEQQSSGGNMGFWDNVGKAAVAVGKGIADTGREANELAEGYRSESDDFLKGKFRNGTMAQKMAAGKILKERGYGNQG